MIGALARPPLARLTRTPRAWIAIGAWGALALASAWFARTRGSPHGADHVLLGAYGPLVLPLLAYATVGAALGARSLSASTAPLVAFGAPPGRAAAVTVAVPVAVCTALGGVLAAVIAVVAHGGADPPLGSDAVTSAYAGALGGAAYASWFALGAAFGRRGGGRTVLLAVDWVLGTNGGASALAVPRGHLRNLLGGAPPMDLAERASAAALVVFAVSCALVAVRRARE